jgi:hypothetical protein
VDTSVISGSLGSSASADTLVGILLMSLARLGRTSQDNGVIASRFAASPGLAAGTSMASVMAARRDAPQKHHDLSDLWETLHAAIAIR